MSMGLMRVYKTNVLRQQELMSPLFHNASVARWQKPVSAQAWHVSHLGHMTAFALPTAEHKLSLLLDNYSINAVL